MFSKLISPLPPSYVVKALCCHLTLLLVCLFAETALSQTPAAQKTPPPAALELNKPVEREIAPGEKHVYRVALAENQYAVVTIEQRGIDVAVVAANAADEAFVQRDSVLKTEGQEKIAFAALADGEYILEIRAKANAPAPGRYRVSLAETRAATEKELRIEQARKLFNESVALYNKGEYDAALKLATVSLESRERELDADDIDIAASLAALALVLEAKGDTEKAISLLQRALKIREKALGTDHQDVARMYHNLALVYDRTGEFEEAIRLYEKAIEIRERVLGANSADLATSLNNLGMIYSNLADFDKAEQFVRRALDIKERTLPPNSNSTAVSVSALAGIFSQKGDEDKALELYKRALEIREKALGPNHPELARSLENLGSSYQTKGDYAQAETNYLRGLEILRSRFGAEHYRIARMLGSLATLYHLRGDAGRAAPLFQETVAMMEKTVGRDHQDYATAIYNLAWFYTDRGEYERAEPLYLQSLAIAEKQFGAQHPDVVIYLKGLARNHQAKGETAQAVNFLTRAHRLSERIAQTILFTSSEKQKLLYLNSLSGETNQYLSAHLKFAPADAKAGELALTTVFERKGRVTDAMAFEFAALRSRFDQSDQLLLDGLKKVTSQLAQKILNGPADESVEAHEKQIAQLEEQKEKLEQEISRKSSEFRARIQPVTIAAIRSAVPENAALIEFGIYRPYDPKAAGDEKNFYGEPRYAAYVLRRRGEVQWKDLGAARAIDEAIEDLRQALRDPKRQDAPRLARAAHEKIMSPLRALLADARHLLVSPDGALNLIPFEALVDEQEQFLVENYSFTYLTSGRDLLRMQTKRADKSKPLVIANPSFGETPAPSEKINSRGKKRPSLTATRNLSDTYFAPLGGTAQEARSIQALFPEATFLTGAQATETALKQTVAPQILHIATHGFFLEDKDESNAAARIENPLLRAGLAFTGANRRKGEKDDGILTALEASGLNLWGTKLVVLSACDTGLGEVRNGEGVYGLRRAFVLAGTESLVMSLWSVSDYVTRELMTGYYKNLKQGAGRGAALRQIQLEMLKKPARRHPFYWASFIQSGEWAELQVQK